MPDQKTLEDWEKKHNSVVVDGDPKKKLTEEEFLEIPQAEKHGVNFKDRIEFLQHNGYEVNRANLVDSSLSARNSGKE